MTQQIGFPYLDKSARFLLLSQHVTSNCRDPFKKHRRRIYVHVHLLRVASEHPSLSLRSGDLLCVNCLKAFRCEVAFEPAGPSSLSQEVAFEPAGPSSNVLSQLLIPQRKIATVQVTICPIDFDYGCISF